MLGIVSIIRGAWVVKCGWNLGLWMGKGATRVWNSKQGAEHDSASCTKAFEFGPRVNEEMLRVFRRELTRLGISGSSLF